MPNLFCVLPAVAFSRALEREGERLDAAEAGGRDSGGLCSVWHAARLHCLLNLFRVLPAVAFSRALEREGEWL
ncbi:hypothetical protein NDU88_002077 [Pleurodeles waltl]|uniref:Uncharacterized protein n=1 Tax=Pleurodeles waltl TaxID=8319 RepID=A0AAV7VDQ9_PLEWA|nr:hypothetical protein NDU88_002077 [Pleurodeles waltl]